MAIIAWSNSNTDPRETVISRKDRMGVTHHARVSWRPRHSDVDAGLSNTGRTLAAWEDTPPVGWAGWADSPGLHLKERVEHLVGDTEEVIEGVEAASADALEPGEFFVHATWEG